MKFNIAKYFKDFTKLWTIQTEDERSLLIEKLREQLMLAPSEFSNKQNEILLRLKGKQYLTDKKMYNFSQKKTSSISKEIILIENYNNHGARVKEFFANNFKELKYQICSLGEMRKYADYWYELDDSLSTNNKNMNFSDEFLFNEIKGSLNREYPNLLESNLRDELDNAINELKNRYLKIYNSVDKYISEYKEILAFGVVWGGMLLESKAIKNAFNKHELDCYALEFSFDRDKFYFDRSGVIGNQHSFSKKLELPDLNINQENQIEAWMKNSDHAKSKQPELGQLTNFIQPHKKNVLLLCQCGIDTVITYDSPRYETTFSAYKDVFKHFSKDFPDVNLIIKLHPGDLTENKVRIEKLANSYGFNLIVNDENPCNVYELMAASDCGITINSQSGLEMMTYKKNVLCLGTSFYTNQGFGLSLNEFTNLHTAIKVLLESSAPNLDRVKKYLYYYLFEYLYSETDQINSLEKVKEEITKEKQSFSKKLLIVHPSGSSGGSGFYLQELAQHLSYLDWQVKIFCEGTTQQNINGIKWYRLKYDGFKTSSYLRSVVIDFDPDIILQVGVRTKSMRSALEAYYLSTNAMFLVQAEDDEESAFLKSYPEANIKLVELLDTPNINFQDLKSFLGLVNWEHTLRILNNPNYDRWVEPIMRLICYKIADAHCSIWHAMADRLYNKFKKPSFILPPIVDFSYYESLKIDNNTKKTLLKEYKIPEDSHILFISGNIYDFSNEFETFIDGIVLASKLVKIPLTLIISGRSRNPEKFNYARKKLKANAYFRSLKIPGDDLYNKFILLSDVICAPGYNDVFNEYRLPGRLVKAVAMKKPIMTFKVGFAEKLESYRHGFFSENDSAESWKELIIRSLDKSLLSSCANLAYSELKKELDARETAFRFDEFCSILRNEKN